MTAIDQQRLTGRELGLRQAEKQHCRGDILRPAHPAKGNALCCRFLPVFANSSWPLCHVAGNHAVDTDAEWT